MSARLGKAATWKRKSSRGAAPCAANLRGALFALLLLTIPSETTPVLTTLYSFGAVSRDGQSPQAAGAIGSGGVPYGTTATGGSRGSGAIFSLAPPTSPNGLWIEAVLYSFTGSADGSRPLGTIAIGNDGVLYTTSSAADPPSTGAVISLTPPPSSGDSWSPAVLYDFTQGSGGYGPQSGVVIGADGVLYGDRAAIAA